MLQESHICREWKFVVMFHFLLMAVCWYEWVIWQWNIIGVLKMPWHNQLNNKWLFGIKQVIHISLREMCHSLVLLCMSWTCVEKKSNCPCEQNIGKLSVLKTIAFWIVQSLTHIFLALFGKEWTSSLGAFTLHKLTFVSSKPTWACSFHADNLS